MAEQEEKRHTSAEDTLAMLIAAHGIPNLLAMMAAYVRHGNPEGWRRTYGNGIWHALDAAALTSAHYAREDTQKTHRQRMDYYDLQAASAAARPALRPAARGSGGGLSQERDEYELVYRMMQPSPFAHVNPDGSYKSIGQLREEFRRNSSRARVVIDPTIEGRT